MHRLQVRAQVYVLDMGLEGRTNMACGSLRGKGLEELPMNFKEVEHRRHICEERWLSRVCVHGHRGSVPTVQKSASADIIQAPFQSSMNSKIYGKFGKLLCRKRIVKINAVMAQTKTRCTVRVSFP